MKISILTPSFNQGKYIEKNIKSVMNQNWCDIEHIIIDGGSTDNTLNILKKYPNLNWISESDNGQADALNKGLRIATGDIIGWINSDDYYENDILKDVVSHFEDPKVMWIIGNITFVYTSLGVEKKVQCKNVTHESLLRNPDIVKQQGTFFRKEMLVEIGGWNKELYMVMDLELWLKISHKYTPKMVNNNYAYFIWHENQKSSSLNILIQAKEINEILISYDVIFWKRYLFLKNKYVIFVKSILKKMLIKLCTVFRHYV